MNKSKVNWSICSDRTRMHTFQTFVFNVTDRIDVFQERCLETKGSIKQQFRRKRIKRNPNIYLFMAFSADSQFELSSCIEIFTKTSIC